MLSLSLLDHVRAVIRRLVSPRRPAAPAVHPRVVLARSFDRSRAQLILARVALVLRRSSCARSHSPRSCLARSLARAAVSSSACCSFNLARSLVHYARSYAQLILASACCSRSIMRARSFASCLARRSRSSSAWCCSRSFVRSSCAQSVENSLAFFLRSQVRSSFARIIFLFRKIVARIISHHDRSLSFASSF